jgi:hypothetical protein
MRQNWRELLALVLGMGLVLLSIRLDKSLHFAPIYLIGQQREWMVGPREIAHVVGVAGLTVAVWYFIRSFAFKRLIALNLALTAFLAVVLVQAWPEHDYLYDYLRITGLQFFFDSPIIVAAWVFCGFFAWKFPEMFRPLPPLVAACGILIATTAVHEFYAQPFVTVYGEPPRGWVEVVQVGCDLVGILIGALIVLKLNGWPGPLHEGKADDLSGGARPLEP